MGMIDDDFTGNFRLGAAQPHAVGKPPLSAHGGLFENFPSVHGITYINVDGYWERLKQRLVASGKVLHNYGTSPFFVGKSTVNGHVQ